MFRFPYFNYPNNYQYYRNYQKPITYQQNNSTTNFENTPNNVCLSSNKTIENYNLSEDTKINNTDNSRSFSDSEQAIFEILGIKLYFDDIIILCILFFLYQENVKDQMLYIILFLLLLS